MLATAVVITLYHIKIMFIKSVLLTMTVMEIAIAIDRKDIRTLVLIIAKIIDFVNISM